MKPGDIFESRLALEVPVWRFFSLLGELAYYDTDTKEIAGLEVAGSAGEALDGLVGITWSRFGWNIGVGAGFGLLEESHTSFDLERGAGDFMYKVSVAYKLTPKKPAT